MLLTELLAYHGTGKKPTTKLKPPIFVTTQREGAEWYAAERGNGENGVILVGDLQVKKPFDLRRFDGYEKYLELAKSAGIEFEGMDVHNEQFFCKEIQDHSPYDGTNSSDLVYIPKFQAALKAAGYDSLHMSDVLTNDEIDTYVIFDPSLFKIKRAEKHLYY
jgi:hypothetical protein